MIIMVLLTLISLDYVKEKNKGFKKSLFPFSTEFMLVGFWKNSSWEDLRPVPGEMTPGV